jgi:hypothetical protein
MLPESGRIELKDKKFYIDLDKESYLNHLFVRHVAKEIKFVEVDFKYSIFDTCYFRDCLFDTCDFTGCRFVSTDFHGSKFSGCKFNYAVFERTNIESDILDTECPGPDNLKLRFARSLRTNYQQIGDANAANKAVNVELQASKEHKKKTWNSNESYYRKKYKGFTRARAFLDWVSFTALDFLWGNGESALKLLRSMVLVLISMSIIDTVGYRDPSRLASYFHSLVLAPQIFLGAVTPTYYPGLYLSLIMAVRLVGFGFLVSIIIKRFNRR